MSISGFFSKTQKLSEVEKAKYWEPFRNLPKYKHKEMAVIHPSPIKKKAPLPPKKPALTVVSSQAILN